MKRTDKTLAKLATTLPSTTDILRGSLLQRRIRHRSGCAVCARGEGHLISVLTVSYPGGRTKQISLRPEQKPSNGGCATITKSKPPWSASVSSTTNACAPRGTPTDEISPAPTQLRRPRIAVSGGPTRPPPANHRRVPRSTPHPHRASAQGSGARLEERPHRTQRHRSLAGAPLTGSHARQELGLSRTARAHPRWFHATQLYRF